MGEISDSKSPDGIDPNSYFTEFNNLTPFKPAIQVVDDVVRKQRMSEDRKDDELFMDENESDSSQHNSV